MYHFNFHNPVRIVFGKDRLAELDALVPKEASVLLLYGGGSIKKYGIYEKVLANLTGRKIFEFGGIEPNPRYDTLMKAVEIVKSESIDFLLGVGGGSVMDGTKFVALAAAYSGENAFELLLDRKSHQKIQNVLPIGIVATLPATGSEMNAGGVVNYAEGKFGFGNPCVYPRFSILDPSLTFTLPPDQVANGVIDTFIHTTEQYLTYPVEARFQDRAAEGILKTLIEIGRKTIDTPTDYDARANLFWCSTMALNGMIGCGVPQDWATHMIGHELTAMFEIDHAKTLAIVAPSLWMVLKEQKKAKLLQYAHRVWDLSQGDENQRMATAIEKTREFFEGLGVKTRLSDYGVKPTQIEDIVKALEKHGKTALSETRQVDLETSRKILEAAF